MCPVGHAPAPFHPTGLYQSSLAEAFPLDKDQQPAFLHQVVQLPALDFGSSRTTSAVDNSNNPSAASSNFDLNKTVLVDGVPLLPYTNISLHNHGNNTAASGAGSDADNDSSMHNGRASAAATGTPRRYVQTRHCDFVYIISYPFSFLKPQALLMWWPFSAFSRSCTYNFPILC